MLFVFFAGFIFGAFLILFCLPDNIRAWEEQDRKQKEHWEKSRPSVVPYDLTPEGWLETEKKLREAGIPYTQGNGASTL